MESEGVKGEEVRSAAPEEEAMGAVGAKEGGPGLWAGLQGCMPVTVGRCRVGGCRYGPATLL